MATDAHHAAGRATRHAYSTSRQYAAFARDLPAADAAKLFLPPMNGGLLQMATPPDPRRAAWCRGFDEARAEGLSDDR